MVLLLFTFLLNCPILLQLVTDAIAETVDERTTNGEGVFSFCNTDRIFVIVSLSIINIFPYEVIFLISSILIIVCQISFLRGWVNGFTSLVQLYQIKPGFVARLPLSNTITIFVLIFYIIKPGQQRRKHCKQPGHNNRRLKCRRNQCWN